MRLCKLEFQTRASSVSDLPGSAPLSATTCDISKCISLVPKFKAVMDSYFAAFEEIAGDFQWPRSGPFYCSVNGKAQGVVVMLPLKDSLDYSSVKSAVLQAYESVPGRSFGNRGNFPPKLMWSLPGKKGSS